MIKQIRIQNFRSLVDVTVELDPLTVLIGRSGTGKSNFVQAIRFLRDCLNARAVNFNSYGGTARVLHVDHQKEPLAFDLTFSIAGLDETFRYALQYLHHPARLDESLQVNGKTLLNHTGGKWVVAPAIHSPPPPNGIMLGAIPGLQESAFAYVALRSGIGCYDFSGDVLTKEDNQGDSADRGLADRGGNYLRVADRILTDLGKAHNWKRIAKGMRAVNRAADNLTLNAPNPDRLDVGLRLNGRTLPIDVRQESEGFRRYLAHMLALYQNPPKQTLLFEHPESGLHPGALESLAHEFEVCPRDGRGQVILTTHSPQLLDYFPPGSIRVVEIHDQRTQIGRIAHEQLEIIRDQLMRAGELLTSDEARPAVPAEAG